MCSSIVSNNGVMPSVPGLPLTKSALLTVQPCLADAYNVGYSSWLSFASNDTNKSNSCVEQTQSNDQLVLID